MGTAEVASGGCSISCKLFGKKAKVSLNVFIAMLGIANTAVANIAPTGGDRPLLLMVFPEAILLWRGDVQPGKPGHYNEKRKASRSN